MFQEFFKRFLATFADVKCISHFDESGGEGYLLPDKPDRRLKLQLSVDIEDLCDLASNKQEELMVEGTDCRQVEEMKW